MNESKYNTISFDKNEGVSFNDMYHFYCCRKLGNGVVACRRVPCYCVSCNKMLQKEWKEKNGKMEVLPKKINHGSNTSKIVISTQLLDTKTNSNLK